jgi:hypothetical protein
MPDDTPPKEHSDEVKAILESGPSAKEVAEEIRQKIAPFSKDERSTAHKAAAATPRRKTGPGPSHLTLITFVMTADPPEITTTTEPAPPAESARPPAEAGPEVTAPDTEPAPDGAGQTFTASEIGRQCNAPAEIVCRVARAMGIAPQGDEPLHSWQISEQDARRLAIGLSIHAHFSRWESANRAAKRIALLKAAAAFPATEATDISAFIREATRDLPEAGPDLAGFPSASQAFARAFVDRRAENELAADIFDEAVNDSVAKLADLGRDFAYARNPDGDILDTEAALEALLCELERKAGLAPAAVVPEIEPSGATTGGSILEQYQAMRPGPERQKFFSEHKAKIVAAHTAASKARAGDWPLSNH